MIKLTIIKPDGTQQQAILVNKSHITIVVQDKTFLYGGGICTRVEIMGDWTFYVKESLDDILKMWK